MNSLSRFFVAIYDRLVSHRGTVWVIFVLLIFVFVGLASILDYKEDISSFLPNNERISKYTDTYVNLSDQGKIAIIFRAKAKDAQTVEIIQRAMESFGELLVDMDSSNCVHNLQIRVDEEKLVEELGFVWRNYPYLLTQETFEHADSLLCDSTYIETQMKSNHQMLMLPTGSVVAGSLTYDPLHLCTSVTSSLKDINISNTFKVFDGYILTNDAEEGLIFFESPYGNSESRQNVLLANLLRDAIDEFYMIYGNGEVEISAIGAPLIAVTNAQQIKCDSIFAMILALVLIISVLIYSFHSLSDIFWMGTSIAVGWLFAIGCIAVIKDSISIIVIGIGSVIIGIAANYPLHFLAHLRHVPDRRTALKEMVSPLVIGNITTVSAFLCLLLLDAEAMHDLGLFGSLMLVGTILFVLIFLPVLIPARQRKNWPTETSNTEIESVTKNRPYRKPLLCGIISVTLVLACFSITTSFDSNMQHINYMTPAQQADMRLLLEDMERNDTVATLYAVAEGNTLEDALRHNEDLVVSLNSISGISKISGIGSLMPSTARQAENLKRWKELWNKHPNAMAQFEGACREFGFSISAFAPFTSLTQEDLEPQTVSYFQEANEMLAKNFIIQNEGSVRIANFIQIEKKRYEEVKAQIKSVIPEGTYAFDTSDLSSNLITVLSDSFNYIGWVCGFVVFLFLWLSFGSIELGMLSFLPLAISWVWILGLMNIFGVQFNIVNIILATFIFGQGDDYTIFITEGILYENAYGKRTLHAYKKSIILSAVIMFIGIGTLVVSKHPALKSLAEVSILGMIIVVVMAYYIPPMVFRMLTTLNGKVREYPVTLKRLCCSTFSLAFFFLTLMMVLPGVYIYSLFERRKEKLSDNIHKLLYKFSKFVIYRVPGTTYRIINNNAETFDKPAIIICNHQSQLDLMAVLELHPKITVLTKEWVWNNPYYGEIIRNSEFYPVTEGIDKYMEGMRCLVRRGYSIAVFPEGTRSASGILRFHKGAFILAQELNLDILPIYLHGFNDVLPRHDFLLREGTMTLEIGNRMSAEEVCGVESLHLRSFFHKRYVQHFETMRRTYETAQYFVPYLKYKYMYRGLEIERRCRNTLKNVENISKLVDSDFCSVESYFFDDPGQGEIPLLFAWVHRNMEVYAEFQDVDDYLVATNIYGLPQNLHYSLKR